MLRKLTLGLVAAASLSAMALAPSAASASFLGRRMGWLSSLPRLPTSATSPVPLMLDGGCYVTRRVMTPYGYRLRSFNVCY